MNEVEYNPLRLLPVLKMHTVWEETAAVVSSILEILILVG